MKLDSQLEELIVEWEVQRLDGVEPDLRELCADCPQLLPQLRQTVQELKATEWMLDVPPDDKEVDHSAGHLNRHELPADTFPGTTIGDYQILERIGAGGMGVVYHARHLHLDRDVALKMLSGFRTSSTDSIKRFQREIRALGRLNHPNIVTAYDARQTDGTWYLVMEYIQGVDSRCVMDSGSISQANACEIVRQASLGLQHAHDHDLIHRDVKPSNLMVGADGVVKVLDLGLARITKEQATSAISRTVEATSTGHVLGTIDYMAPEQMDDGASIDSRADVYGLGATLFRLLTGRIPIDVSDDATPLAKVRAASLGQQRSIAQLRPELPQLLTDLVTQMLQSSPDDRRLTAGNVAARLEPFCVDADLTELPRTHQSEVATNEIKHVWTDDANMAISRPETSVRKDDSDSDGSFKPPRGKTAGIGPWFAGLTMLLLFAAGVIYVETDYGTLEVHAGDGVTVETLKSAGVRIVHKGTDKTYDLTTGPSKQKAGAYEIKVTQLPDQLQFSTTEFAIARGEPTELIVRLKVRPPAHDPTRMKTAESLLENTSPKGTQVTVDPPDTMSLRFNHKPIEGRIWHFRFSPDGSRLYVSGVGDAVVGLETRTGKEVLRLTGFTEHSRGLALSDDGKSLYCGDGGGRILEYEADSGELKRTLFDRGGSIRDIQLSPDGTLLAFADDKIGLRVIDLGTGKEAHLFRGSWYSCPFGQDNSTLFGYGLSRNPSRIDLRTGTIQALREEAIGKAGFVTQARNNAGALVWHSGEVEIIDLRDGKLQRSMSFVPGRQLCLAMPAKQNLLAISGLTPHVQILNTNDGKLNSRITVPSTRGCQALRFSPDGSALAVGTHEGRVLLFDSAADAGH